MTARMRMVAAAAALGIGAATLGACFPSNVDELCWRLDSVLDQIDDLNSSDDPLSELQQAKLAFEADRLEDQIFALTGVPAFSWCNFRIIDE